MSFSYESQGTTVKDPTVRKERAVSVIGRLWEYRGIDQRFVKMTVEYGELPNPSQPLPEPVKNLPRAGTSDFMHVVNQVSGALIDMNWLATHATDPKDRWAWTMLVIVWAGESTKLATRHQAAINQRMRADLDAITERQTDAERRGIYE